MKAKDSRIERLRAAALSSNNSFCFLERERLRRESVPAGSSYAELFSKALASLSCPIDADDVFLGRMVEGPAPSEPPRSEWNVLTTNGHMTLDWRSLLEKGLDAIAGEAEANAASLGTEDALFFAKSARTCVAALDAFAKRWATEAKREASTLPDDARHASLLRAAAALERVPRLPARNLFEALQSVWLVHLVMSCVVGSRDFAFGRLDRFLLPFFEADLKEGRETQESVRDLLAFFFLKSNEIVGTSAYDFEPKPIPSVASKQYLMIGGRDGGFNALSRLVLEAALLVKLPQPTIAVRLGSKALPSADSALLAEVLAVSGSQLHFFNDELVVPELVRAGVAPSDAESYGMVGCCRPDLPGLMDDALMRTYSYMNVSAWLLAALSEGPASRDEALALFEKHAEKAMRSQVEADLKLFEGQPPRQFQFESLLLRGCVERCLSARSGGCSYVPRCFFWGGLASAGDILSSVEELSFKKRELGVKELLRVAASDFKDSPALLAEAKALALKFGNGSSSSDANCVALAEILVKILDKLRGEVSARSPKTLLLSGFYSLNCHHSWGRSLPGTPDGRLSGEPLSENQSPVYGCDVSGPTALLKSVSSLPLRRAVAGGLNVKFSGRGSKKHLDLLLSYFAIGGLHLGFTFVDRATLLAAKAKPQEHKGLCVRLYGFSEYFNSLSPHDKDELIKRTEN